MDCSKIGEKLYINKFFLDEFNTIKAKIDGVWSGPAANSISSAYTNIIKDLNDVEYKLQIFSSIIMDVNELKNKKIEIESLERKINAINIYKLNEITKKIEIDQTKLDEKKQLEDEKAKCINEYNSLKQNINNKLKLLLESKTSDSKVINSSKDVGCQLGELSYDEALVIAEKLDVPVNYVLSLHLHEGYKLGDKIIIDEITPDMIHYAGEHGYPVVIDGVENMGTEYCVQGRNGKLYKSADSYTAIYPGGEYNIAGQPVTFEEMEGKNVYWTWYGPICQGFGGDPCPIQCTDSALYPCDDGLYRDADGYIVIAGSPYKNQYYDGVHVNYDAHGGLEEEDLYVLTPFGIGKFYDNGAATIQNGIECDIYRNDGYESNNIASTKYGRRLRKSAVEGYETLGLYWKDLIH